MERTRWDSVFGGSAFHYGTDVNDWIRLGVERYVLNGQWFANLGIDLPEELHVCELASGEGRNAVWLAEQEFEVTAFDRSIEGLNKARSLADEHGVRISTHAEDVLQFQREASGWEGVADVVVSSYFHVPRGDKRNMFRAHRHLVRPGGLIIAEWFHPDQRKLGFESGGPPDPLMMVTPEELRTQFAEWRILECARRNRTLNEGNGHNGPAAVTQFAAQRPVF
jgi:SAM-dependent methyltransferase